MLIECHHCKAIVEGKLLATHESYDPEEDPAPFKVGLIECPRCKTSLVGGEYIGLEFEEEGISSFSRLWPSPRRSISWHIPPIVRTSLEEADRCLRANAFTAAAVMCGRALEGICRHHKTKSQYLGGGLKELL
ncbi:MAG: hypothetical protein J0M12_10355, partial [Deltaproteobacteria bacterium]|nr:hypothetical protein [Deltaproteobacteria bacterium]